MIRYFCCLLLATVCACKSDRTDAAPPLRVGMELSTPPFEMTDAEGRPDGIGVRLAEALAADLKRPLEIQVIAFKGLETALKTGKIDIILSSMTDTPKRRESISFSDPYCRIGLAILVPADSNMQTAEDLKKPGTRIVARLGTTAVGFIKDQFPEAEVILLDQNAACLLEITQKKSDAFIYDQLSILRLHLAQPESTRALLTPLRTEAWAMAVRKDDTALQKQINQFLSTYRAAKGLETLGERYLKTEKAELARRGIPFILE